MRIFLVEAMRESDPFSVRKKWNRKYRHHPKIRGSLVDFQYRNCLDFLSFEKALEEFELWQRNACGNVEDDKPILWISVHGAATRLGIELPDGSVKTMHDAIGRLSHRLVTNVVMIQSICWGALPTISFVMNNSCFGPSIAFGPTISVRITALHHAERETLKLLASEAVLNERTIKAHIDGINRWGATHHVRHDKYYRVWYWKDDPHRAVSYPGSTFFTNRML